MFCGDIPLHRPYIGLIYDRYLQFRILEWPLIDLALQIVSCQHCSLNKCHGFIYLNCKGKGVSISALIDYNFLHTPGCSEFRSGKKNEPFQNIRPVGLLFSVRPVGGSKDHLVSERDKSSPPGMIFQRSCWTRHLGKPWRIWCLMILLYLWGYHPEVEGKKQFNMQFQ